MKSRSPVHDRKRFKNYAVFFAVLGFMLVIYAVSIIRMSGG